MIGTKFTHEGREYVVAERCGPRSHFCSFDENGITGSINLSTRVINKCLGKGRPKAPIGEDAAATVIEGVLQELDQVAQVRIVRDLAVKYLNETAPSQ